MNVEPSKILVVFLFSFAIILTGFFVQSVNAEGSLREATIVDYSGDVALKRGGGEEPIEVFEGVSLTRGDQVLTGRNSWVKVEVEDKAEVRLSENSKAYVRELIEYADEEVEESSFSLFSGGFFGDVKETLSTGSRFEVDTSTSVMGVRGTRFYVNHEDDKTDVSVISGSITVTTRAPADEIDEPDPDDPEIDEKEIELQAGEHASLEEQPDGTVETQEEDLTQDHLDLDALEIIRDISEEEPDEVPEELLVNIDEAIEERREEREKRYEELDEEEPEEPEVVAHETVEDTAPEPEDPEEDPDDPDEDEEPEEEEEDRDPSPSRPSPDPDPGPDTYDVTLNVRDEEDMLRGAEFNLAGVGTKTTNSRGEIVFEDLEEGSYDYEISKDGYTTKIGSINIDSDFTKDFTLKLEEETKEPSMSITPLFLSSDEAYDFDDPADLELIITNDTVAEEVYSEDISLSRDIEAMNIADVTREDDNTVFAEVYGEVDYETGIGTITLMEDALEKSEKSLKAYVITGYEDITYNLELEKYGHKNLVGDDAITGIKIQEDETKTVEVEMKSEETAEIEGVVLFDGEPMENIEVEINREKRYFPAPDLDVVTDENGEFTKELVEGYDYSITFEKREGDKLYYAEKEISLNEDKDIELEPEEFEVVDGYVSGRVIDHDEQPLEGTKIDVYTPAKFDNKNVDTDENGEFELKFDFVKDSDYHNNYWINVSKSGYVYNEDTNRTVYRQSISEPMIEDIEVQLFERDPFYTELDTGVVRGRLMYEDGTPFNRRFDLYHLTDDSSNRVETFIEPDENGYFEAEAEVNEGLNLKPKMRDDHLFTPEIIEDVDISSDEILDLGEIKLIELPNGNLEIIVKDNETGEKLEYVSLELVSEEPREREIRNFERIYSRNEGVALFEKLPTSLLEEHFYLR